MFTPIGVPAFAGISLNHALFFARQPEPDLELTEDDLADATPHASSPMKSPKPSNKRPILWLLLLAVLGGVAYIAMDPDMIMRILEPYLGDSEQNSVSTVPPPQAEQSPAASAVPPLNEPPAPPAVQPPSMTKTAPGGASPTVPGPLFGEGQKVSVVPDPARPNGPVLLFADAARTKPGPTVAAGSSLTVLDGDLQGANWIYAVATEDGRKGWVAEKHLKFRR
jgi:hypothetical protein